MPANRDSCQNEELPFLRIDTTIDTVLQYRQLLKRHPIRFRYMCKCISVLVPATLILPVRVSYFSISTVKNHRQEWSKRRLSLAAGCYFEPGVIIRVK